jgi:hypothetical protein
MAQTYQILIVLFIIFISLITYWNSQIHKSKKFIYLMQLVGTMGIYLRFIIFIEILKTINKIMQMKKLDCFHKL